MRRVRRSQTAVTESLVDRANSIAERHSFRFGNRTEIGLLRGENPVRPGFIFPPWRRWNSQFNKLRRDSFVANWVHERSDFAMRQQRDMSGNRGMLGIFCDPVPVNESVLILPIVSVKTDLDAVTVGLVWNLKCCRGAQLEL